MRKKNVIIKGGNSDVRRSALALLLGCLLLVAGVSALDGYDYYQTIEYAGCDQATYQQDIVIHRSTGTAYNETSGGLETWHIFVGEHCQVDFDDVRFTNSTGELAYYLWPDYDSSSARFAVRLEGATSAGTLTIHYGNAAAATTSDKSATYVDAISNPSFETTGSWTWTKDSTAGNSLTLPSTGWYSEGAASVYFYVGWAGGYSGAHYSQISQTVSLPAGDYLLEFDVKGSSITSGYGYMEVWIDGIQKYRKTSAGEGYHQLTSPFTSDGSVSVTLKNGIAAGGVTRYASGYWDALALRYYSPSPPAALTFSGEHETAGPYGGLAPLTVQFTDRSTGHPTSWSWSFGDGNTSTAQNPQHTYTTPGTYTVTLTATNEHGSDYELKANYITVYAPINAQFTATTTAGLAPLTVQFTDLSTGGPTSWLWNFGDGSNSTVQNPEHTYTSTGYYNVSLTSISIYDEDTIVKIGYIEVRDTPEASFSCDPIKEVIYSPITFTDQSLNVPTSWLWDFGDGVTSTEQNPMHSYSTEGSYTISLKVENEYGEDEEIKVGYLDIGSLPQVDFNADFTYVGSPYEISFSDSTQSYGGITSWSWNFGDGTTSTSQNPSHTFPGEGEYTISLTVVNPYGQSQEIKENYIHCIIINAFPGYSNIPQDLDGDGKFEDINGNGKYDYNDFLAYFNNLYWCKENQPPYIFDFNGNGRVDYSDTQALWSEIENNT